MATSIIENPNQILEWKYLGNCGVGDTKELPSKWNEIKCVTKNNDGRPSIEMNSVYAYAVAGNSIISNGYCGNTSYYGYARCTVTANSLKFEEYTHIGATPSGAILLIFYR